MTNKIKIEEMYFHINNGGITITTSKNDSDDSYAYLSIDHDHMGATLSTTVSLHSVDFVDDLIGLLQRTRSQMVDTEYHHSVDKGQINVTGGEELPDQYDDGEDGPDGEGDFKDQLDYLR